MLKARQVRRTRQTAVAQEAEGVGNRAYRPWLEAEINLIGPQIIVCLGASAAQSFFGASYRLTQERGKFVRNSWAPHVTSRVHPSAVLRAPDEQRGIEYEEFVADLKEVHRLWKGLRK